MAFATAFLVMLMATPFVLAANAQTTVDWTLGKDYSTYSTQSFTPGSTIEFDYSTPTHDLLVVSKSDYDNCNAANPIQTFTDGKSTVTLKQGATYFICGTLGHCSAGMKLQVNAADSGSSTPTTPTTTPTMPKTTPAMTPMSAPGPTGSAQSPVAHTSGANAGLNVGGVVFGVSLILSAVFALV